MPEEKEVSSKPARPGGRSKSRGGERGKGATASREPGSKGTNAQSRSGVDSRSARPRRRQRTPEPVQREQLPLGPKLRSTITPADIDREYTEKEYQEMLGLYSDTLKTLEEGVIVEGKILELTDQVVIVDIGFKSEGILSLAEFTDSSELKVGDKIEVFLEAIEDQDGQLVLSKRKADFLRVWDRIKDAFEKGQAMDGKIIKRIKGGMVVDLQGVEAFLPGSQIALKQVPNFDDLVGQRMPFRIVKLNKARRNIVVSRRILLEEERESQRSRILGEISAGQTREGVVKNIIDFGAFIDLGGVDGLLHITDMSWGRISHPSEVVSVGDRVQVKITDVDTNTGRISLGLKQLTPYPWEGVEENYPVNKRVNGKVVSLTDYGAFVELEKGVEGLIHISEMSWTGHVKHPSKLLSVGQTVEAVVLSVDKANEKISLGLKQLEPDPWIAFVEHNPPGKRLTGKVRNLTNFGAFVELKEGVDGLVHISDMSWTKRLNHPAELMRKGDNLEVVILNVDLDNRRISLGHKQIQDDPWPKLSETYPVGTEATGKLTKLLDKGVVVELEGEVEGFIPLLHLARPDIRKPEQAFQEGDKLPVEVIEFDGPSHRVVLSVETYFKDKDRQQLEEYQNSHPIREQKADEITKPPEIPVPPLPESSGEVGGADGESDLESRRESG